MRARAIAAVVGVLSLGLATIAPVGADGTDAPLASWNVKALPVPARDIAYDESRDVLLATVPGSNASLGNELVELDPETGALGRRLAVGSDPGPIAVTTDGVAAFVGLRGVNRIVRVDLASFTVTASFSTGSDSFFGPRYWYRSRSSLTVSGT